MSGLAKARDSHDGLERYAWLALLTTVALVPLAVAKLPFMAQPLTFAVFVFPQNVALALGAAVTAALWGAAAYRGGAELRLSRPMLALAAFLAWAGVATAFAWEPARSFFGASTSPLAFVQILGCSVLAFLAIQMVGSAKRMRALTWTVIASSTAVALFALPQQFLKVTVFGLPMIEPWLVERGFSTIGNPDQLGTFLILPAALAGVLLLLARDRNERVAAGGCLAVLLAVLVGTLTRGAWVAAAIGVAAAVGLLLRTSRDPASRKRAASLLAIALVATVLAFAGAEKYQLLGFRLFPGTAVTGTTAEAANIVASGRLSLWRASLSIVAQRPLTGTGPAAFELGWYPNAIRPSSAGGAGGIAKDPHSLLVLILATTGVIGLAAYLALVAGAFAVGARSARALLREGEPSGTSLYYLAWVVGALALHVGLLVAAVTTPIVVAAFLSLAVLLRPSARPVDLAGSGATRALVPAAAALAALVLVAATYPQLAAERAMALMLQGGPTARSRAAALSVPWNIDVQQAYFSQKAAPVHTALSSGSAAAKGMVDELVAELETSAARQPRELYYEALRTQLLTEAAGRLNDRAYAEAAVAAADRALAIMPAHIPTRVNLALAESYLERYPEMAKALEGYWMNEAASAYPGILYAQALALSGKPAEAARVFDELSARFPADASIAQYRQQTEQLVKDR